MQGIGKLVWGLRTTTEDVDGTAQSFEPVGKIQASMEGAPYGSRALLAPTRVASLSETEIIGHLRKPKN